YRLPGQARGQEWQLWHNSQDLLPGLLLQYAHGNARTIHTLPPPAKPVQDEHACTTLHKEQHHASENRLRGLQPWYLAQAETIPTLPRRRAAGRQKQDQCVLALP